MIKQSNFFTHNIDVTWKTFVRESCDDTELPTERKDYYLAFRGDEAKETYEKIINDQNCIALQLERKYGKSRTLVNRSTIPRPTSSNERKKNHQVPKENVTINAILKAVEQKDLIYLSRYMTRENVNFTDDFGWTPLMSAAYCGHLDIIEFLLNLGANRKAREKSGLTAAQLALKKNYLNIVALLKKKSEFMPNKTSPETDANVSEKGSDDPLQTRPEFVEPLKDRDDTNRENNDNVKECSANSTGFYCKICKVNFHETTWRNHETSTLHVFNSKPKLPNASVYGISKQNKGYQMLLNHGWDEQVGLGPSGKGIKYPIKTCLKLDRKGLGQSNEKEYRITHFKPGDVAAVNDPKTSKQKCLKKKDREKLLNKEARKERALRIALT